MNLFTSLFLVVCSMLVTVAGSAESETGLVTPLLQKKDSIKVATVQMVIPEDFLKDHDPVDALIPHIQRAVNEGCDLVVFPE